MQSFEDDWIAVTDRLPTTNQNVMVMNDGEIIASAQFEKNEWIDNGGRRLTSVTHWRTI